MKNQLGLEEPIRFVDHGHLVWDLKRLRIELGVLPALETRYPGRRSSTIDKES
jgi:hypothetical protein